MGTQKNRLDETVLLRTQNTCLNLMNKKIISTLRYFLCLTGPMKQFQGYSRIRVKVNEFDYLKVMVMSLINFILWRWIPNHVSCIQIF